MQHEEDICSWRQLIISLADSYLPEFPMLLQEFPKACLILSSAFVILQLILLFH